MSTINKIMSMAAMASMAAEVSESNYKINKKKKNFSEPEHEWKRKKCKTCIKCGSDCYPYVYNGRILFKYSKPKFKACEKYSFNKK